MYYVAINVIKLVTFDDDKINLTIRKLDLNEEGPIEYKGNDPMLFWTMKYTKNGHHVLMLDDEYLKPSDPKKKPYLNINFYQEKVDWNKYDSNAVNPRQNMYDFKQYPAHQCSQEDFCGHKPCSDEAKSIFANWDGLSIICPDWKSMENTKINV